MTPWYSPSLLKVRTRGKKGKNKEERIDQALSIAQNSERGSKEETNKTKEKRK